MIKVTGLNEIYRGAFQGLGRLSVVFLPPGLQWFEPGTFRNFSSSNLSLGINFNRYQEVPKDLFEGITLRRDSSKAKPCLTLIGQGGKKLYPEVLKPFLKIDRMVFKLQVDSDEERSDLEEFIEKLRPFVEDCSIDEKSDVFAWVCQFKRS